MKSCVTQAGPCDPTNCCAHGKKPGFASQPTPGKDCADCWKDERPGSRTRYVCTLRCNVAANAGKASHPVEDAFAIPPVTRLAADNGPKPYHGVLPPKLAADAVNKPDHYMRFKIEPIRFCTENALGFLEGNIVKYTARHDAKGGKEDLKKAIRYAVMLIKYRYKDDADFWKTDDALAAYLGTL